MTEATPLLTGVDFITLPTKNYDHAAEFYGDVLGLPFSKRWEISRPASSRRAT